MANEEKGLDYYLQHPNEADPSDHALMAKLLAADADVKVTPAPADTGSKGGEDDPSKVAADAAAKAAADQTTKDAADKAAAEKAATEKAAADAKAKAEEEAAGVSTKDGKGVIPFAVLSDARTLAKNEADARQRAEADAAAARAENDKLKGELAKALEKGGIDIEAKDKGNPTLAEIDKQIAELDATDAPWMKGTLTAMRNAIAESDRRAAAAEERAATMEKQFTTQIAAIDAKAKASGAEEVGEAIDNNPALALWSGSKDPAHAALWQAALKFDAQLLESPAWKDKPMADRFTKVVELVASVHGDAVLPPGYSPTGVKKDPPPADPAAVAKAKAIADEALKNAQPAATTLSDIPGGNPVEQDPLTAAEKMSVEQMGTAFMNMTPTQQQAYLAKFQ